MTEQKLIEIPEGWDVLDVTNDISYVKGKSNTSYDYGDYVYISPEYLRSGENPMMISKFMKCVFAKDTETILLWDGSNAGEVFRSKKGILASTMVKFNLNGKLDADYFFYGLKFQEDNIKAETRGSGIPHVDKGTLSRLNYLFPKDIQEQRKIALILSTLDQDIEETKAIIKKYHMMKEGMMKDIIDSISSSETISFNDKKYVSLITKGTTPTTYGYEFVDVGINFVKVESIGKEGEFLPQQFQYIDYNTHQYLKRSQLKEKDIVFSIAGALGRCAMVDKKILPANTNQAVAVIRFKEGVNVKYVLCILNSSIIQEYIKKNNVQLAQANLSLGNVSKFSIPYPSPEKQEQIVRVSDSINNKIFYEEAHLDKLIKTKAGLMHDLLTGSKRVRI